MTEHPDPLEGGCACGAVRFRTWGDPLRVGLCHCMTCRKAHGAAFNPFIVFARTNVEVVGVLAHWDSTPGHSRDFCPKCGSRIVLFSETEAELSLGGFDQPSRFQPQYEAWTTQREAWLEALDAPQFIENRDPAGPTLPPFRLPV
jgi:hypothetical protein